MQSKTLKELRESFKHRLLNIYEAREAENITVMLLMQLFKLQQKTDLVLLAHQAANAAQWLEAEQWMQKLEAGQPVQHVLGEVYFDELTLVVNEHVLIPRPETEELLQLIINTLNRNFGGVILDVGTGSGCLALGLKYHLRSADVLAVDVSDKALAVAQKNAVLNHLEVHFNPMDFLNWRQEWSKAVDVIVSNPPYIPLSEKGKMDPNLVKYEPYLALFTPDNDPLLFYREILAAAQKHLKTGGWVFFELHENYAQNSLQLAHDMDFKATLHVDMQMKKRFLAAQYKLR